MISNLAFEWKAKSLLPVLLLGIFTASPTRAARLDYSYKSYIITDRGILEVLYLG